MESGLGLCRFDHHPDDDPITMQPLSTPLIPNSHRWPSRITRCLSEGVCRATPFSSTTSTFRATCFPSLSSAGPTFLWAPWGCDLLDALCTEFNATASVCQWHWPTKQHGYPTSDRAATANVWNKHES